MMSPIWKVIPMILLIQSGMLFEAEAQAQPANGTLLKAGTSFSSPAFIQAIPQIDLSIGGSGNDSGGGGDDFSLAIQAIILITILSFGSAFVTMMTSFTRIIVVFFFLRMGLGTQQSPPQ